MKINQLDGYVAFLAVARSRSFTAAAAQLEVSPQAVSQAVRALEERLQSRLLNRTTRSVALSEAGERFMAKVGPALADLLEAQESLRELRDRPSGLLRINLSRAAFTAVIRPRLGEFHRLYPELGLELGFDDGLVDIVAEGYDGGIRLGEAVARDMVSVPLSRRERSVVVAAPEYLARKGTPRTIADLAGHDCIRFRMPSGGGIYRWELVSGKEAVAVDAPGTATANDTDALIAMARAGMGLAYVLGSNAEPWLATGELVAVLDKYMPSFPGFHFYYPSRHQLPAKLRCFLDFWKAA
ncbi:LysR family transcriptional regulator [Denitratisoma sp. agr-D3]